MPLVPAEPGEIGMYVCGATVQSEPHVGHGRYAVAFDVIRRYLEWRGNKVTYVRNITDIDDKIIDAAAEAGESVSERALRMASVFAQAYRSLSVLPPDVEPKATEHGPEMLALITQLIDRGLAYPAPNGDVYFSVRSFEGYGRLSKQRPDELVAGARIEVTEAKNDPLDFALWNAAKPGEPSWESPWGPGRPGWHIECSAMATRYLGADFAIHGGGNDLIFPHHENEIAQSEGANGSTFSRYWLHNGMVNLSGEKMSKSTGRQIGLLEAISEYGGATMRLFYLRAHYRSPLEYSEELLQGAQASIERIRRFVLRAPKPSDLKPEPALLDRFVAAMDNDFATPEALAAVFEGISEANRSLDQGDEVGALVAAIHEFLEVLGLDPKSARGDATGVTELAVELGLPTASLEETMGALLQARTQARAERDFARSDLIRNRLGAAGIIVEDTADGPRWFWR
ncbi:cysteine--tRNA ligase [soil metagenome]